VNDESQYMEVFLDLLPNQPKDDQSRDNFRGILRQKLEERLADSIERIWDLPPIILTPKPKGDYLALLLESRELYVDGHFYPCVAMCGIVGERLVKDALRVVILIQSEGSVRAPSDKAFAQLERVEVYGIVNFLKETNILSGDAAKAALKLGELRNDYAHARGKAPQSDALRAIKLLHTVVEGTVSAFKDFEIRDGVFVPKGDSPSHGNDPEA